MTVMAQRGRLFGAGAQPHRSETGAPASGHRTVTGLSTPGLALYVPAGWPEGVQHPAAPDWEASASAFLLDCCPADYRSYAVLRRHPVVLARFAAEFVESQVRACREGLGEARASLGEVVAPEVVEAATHAWLEQEAVLRRRRREVALVEEALRGKVFIRKM